MTVRWSMLGTLWVTTVLVARAGENAAPSSHLVFDDNFEGDVIINEVRVPEGGEALYTYYEALGWGGQAGGYAGIQAHPRGHNYIFSIWDHESHAAPIRAVHRGPGTLTEKFGGEGTGLKSWNFELGWKVGTWYTLVSRCWPVGDHSYHGFWVRSGATGEWTHLVTMDVAVKEAWFAGGTDAFIEDWLETGVKQRTTHLRGGWKRKRDGSWFAFGSGRYSVNTWDLEPGKRSFHFRTNWNGGVERDEGGAYYFMTAGGDVTKPSTTNPSSHAIPREEARPGYAPLRIASARARRREDGVVEVSWENDPQTLPQFGVKVTVFGDLSPPDKGLASVTVADPHVRAAELPLPAGTEGAALSVRLEGMDILDNGAEAVSVAVGP